MNANEVMLADNAEADAVSGKEDPLKHPYVILINIHEYECQQQNQPRKKFFRDR